MLELIQNSAKSQDIKINAQKSVAFLYTNNEAAEREIKKSILFTTAPNAVRSLGINLIKEVNDLYTGNYRRHMKEVEEDTKKWESIPYSWIRSIMVKTPALSKAIYAFNAILIKIQTAYFTAGTNNSKTCMEPDKTPNGQRNVEKENKIWEHHNA